MVCGILANVKNAAIIRSVHAGNVVVQCQLVGYIGKVKSLGLAILDNLNETFLAKGQERKLNKTVLVLDFLAIGVNLGGGVVQAYRDADKVLGFDRA